MVDDDFADAVSAAGGQHGHEAVQLAVEPHFAQHLAAVALHAAVVVVQFHARQAADHGVEDPRRQDLVPGIVADLLPAADDVEIVFHGGQEPRDLVRIVLQVGVERHDHLAADQGEAGAQGGRLAEVAAEANAADLRIGRGQAADDVPGIVPGTIIDEDHVQLVAVGRGHFTDLAMQGFQALGLVVYGNDDGKHVLSTSRLGKHPTQRI